MAKKKNRGQKSQSGGVNISGGSVSTGGDIVGRDKVTHGDSVTGDKVSAGNIGAGAAVAFGRGAQASVSQSGNIGATWDAWRNQMFEWIDKQPNLSPAEKQDAKDSVEKINKEAKKGDQADPQRLERLINTLAIVGPDAFEVAVTTIMNPLLGIGLVLKKISDKAKLERAAQSSKPA